jgi:phospholipid transport system substrate-binding protein
MSRPVRLALALLILLAPAARAGDSARAVVERMTNAALDVLRDKSLDTETKRHKLESIVYAETDFPTMSRLVLARNWEQFSPAQQTDFVEQFRQLLSVTYGRNIDNYRNERVVISGEREEARGDWTVQTKIVRGGGASDIEVDYRLRHEGDTWRIIDVIIERVSLVANFRSQFQDLMSRGGVAHVLDVLHEKNSRGEPLSS